MTDKDIAEIYRDMELELVESMKRNLGLHLAEEAETQLEYPQWQAIKLKELRKYQKQNKAIIKRRLRGLPSEVAKLLRDELKQGRESEIRKFRKAIGEQKYRSAVMMNDSFFNINTRLVDNLISEIHGSMHTAEHAALRMMNDTYRDVIAKAALFQANGVATEAKAVDMATKDFLNRGLNCIEYRDGRRVNIADYCSMAVRTAQQRAYMMGEGEFRKSIGETLIIISRHNTACELCRPFERKVLIDDVYSGGKQSDGDYMLLSEAMRLGLFHPRCRHGLGTYYPELEDINGYETEDNKLNDYGSQQANEAHINNMIQRYKRLTLGSLDPDNVKKYQERLKYWKKQKVGLESVDNSNKSDILNLQIDDFVPCLKDAKTGEIIETFVTEMNRADLEKYNVDNDWNDDWSLRPKDEHIFAVFIEREKEPQGLISIKYQKGCTYLASASTAPWNNKLLTGTQRYKGVGGHLFAVGVEQSLKHTGSPVVYGYASNEKVLQHYIEKFGAIHSPFVHEYQFFIEDEDAVKLLETYNYTMR